MKILFFTPFRPRPVFLALGLLLGVPLAAAAQLQVTSVSPTRNLRNAPQSANVVLGFSSPLNAATAGNARVFSAQRGGQLVRGGNATASGSTLTVNPAQNFKPGETVHVTVPATVTSSAGAAARPYVYQFTAAAGAGAGTFSGGSDLALGIEPLSVAVGDVDGDGDLDLLTANYGDSIDGNTVSVRLNNGSGTFSGGSDPTVGTGPTSVAVGDVDGDGDLDLLTASITANTVSVRFNNGSGTFSSGSDPAVGRGPQSVAVGDVDGDGDLDLLTANQFGNTVSVRLNDGSGTFSGGSDPAVGTRPTSVAVGDVDGDGDLDLLTANYDGDNVSVRLNNGSGTFSGGSDPAVDTYPVSVAVGDVDGDGDLDLLTANGNITVSVRLNNGSGTFSGGSDPVVGLSPSSVAVGDVDGDGDLDLLTANDNLSNTVSVRLNDGSGVFSGGSNLSVGSNSHSVAVGDVDGDGDLDLLTANYRGGTVSVRLNQVPDQLSGTVYLDTNGNGTRNPGEGLVEQPVVVEVQPGPFYLSTTAGAFGVGVAPGNYTLSLSNPSPYYTVTPATHSAAFTAAGQTDTTNHFGLQPTGSVNDLRVTLTATSAFRAGRAVQYVVTCDNPGTTTQTGVTASLTLDPQVTYTSSVPAATVAGQTLTWNIGALAPFQRRTFVVNGELPTTIQRGDSVTSVATLTSAQTDVAPADNTDTNTTLVTGSYDPNDKQVSTERLTPAQVQAGAWLTYTIRFQNTGNDTAFAVVLRDTLSAHVQRGTLEVLASSHPMTWQLKGAGVAEFRFPNILLPDSGRNEAASHGFVKYRVRVLPTLALGDSVTNAADIYFDFNLSVRTNTAVTRVRVPLGTSAPTPRLLASLYPNPTTSAVRLTLETPAAGRLQIRVFNALGQVVWQEQTAVKGGQVNRTLPAGQWRAGVYHVQVRCGEQLTTQQLVVQP